MNVEPASMKFSRFKVGTAMLFSGLVFCVHNAHAWQSDNGDGTFGNPVFYADSPDPGIVRATNDFCMVSTTFADSHGINVLHSKDLVNREIVSPRRERGWRQPSADGLALGNWLNVTSPAPQIVGSNWQVALPPPAAAGQVFYRLTK
jgi:hypothetical protein